MSRAARTARIVLVIVAVVILANPLLSAPRAFAGECAGLYWQSGEICRHSSGVSYDFEDSRGGVGDDSETNGKRGSGGGGSGPQYEYLKQTYCEIAFVPGDPGCAHSMCTVDGADGLFVLVSRRIVGSGEPYTYVRYYCDADVPSTLPVTALRPVVQNYIREHVYRGLDEPAVTTAPPGGVGLVNFPMIVSTPNPGPVTFTVANPVPATITVTPAYLWRWPDGSTDRRAGRAWRSADNLDPWDPRTYVLHLFEDNGPTTVRLDVSWTATITATGQAPVSLPPIVFSTTTPLRIKEGRTVLVAPD